MLKENGKIIDSELLPDFDVEDEDDSYFEEDGDFDLDSLDDLEIKVD